MQQCLAECSALAMARSPRKPKAARYVASVRCALTKLSSCARGLVLREGNRAALPTKPQQALTSA